MSLFKYFAGQVLSFEQEWCLQLRSKSAAPQDEEKCRWQLLFPQVAALLLVGLKTWQSQDVLPPSSILLQGAGRRASQGRLNITSFAGLSEFVLSGDEVGI